MEGERNLHFHKILFWTLLKLIKQGLAHFSLKGQVVNILGLQALKSLWTTQSAHLLSQSMPSDVLYYYHFRFLTVD